MKAKAIDISNAGPIEALKIPIPEEGGVVVLHGHNGAGKTEALEAARALLGGKGRPPIRDGAASATVLGLGVNLLVGRKAHRSGEAEVRALEGVDPSELVDPGIKDPEAADVARIRALCVLAGAKPDPQLFVPLVPDGAVDLLSSEALDAADLPTLAGRFKRAFESRARALETEGAGLLRESQGIAATVEDVDTSREHDERKLAAASEAAVRRVAELEASEKRALSEHARVAAARAKLDGIAVPDVGELEAVEEAAGASFEAARRLVADLREKLAAAQEAASSREREWKGAREQVAAGRKAVAERLDLVRIVEAILEPGPAPDEILRARDAADRARLAQQHGAVIRHTFEQAGKAEALRDRAHAAAERAERFRAAARSTEVVLSEAIGRVATRGLVVEGGRLQVHHEARGKLVPYGELSHGERWRIALDVAIDSLGEGGLLVVRQEAWEGLDPENRSAVAEHARARRTVVLTAEATEGELGARVLGAGA